MIPSAAWAPAYYFTCVFGLNEKGNMLQVREPAFSVTEKKLQMRKGESWIEPGGVGLETEMPAWVHRFLIYIHIGRYRNIDVYGQTCYI